MKTLFQINPLGLINRYAPSRVLLVTAASLALLSACGGGGSGGSGSPPPAAVSANNLFVGNVSGFGSVIVNGKRFDDTNAQVEIEDAEDKTSDDNRGLKIGSSVEMVGKSDDSTSTGVASMIRMEAELRGPVKSVSPAATGNGGTFTSMGLTVNADDKTALFGLMKVGDLKAGDVVQVHGIRKDDGSINAKLIELRANVKAYKTVGLVSNHNSGAKTFNIGTLTVKYDATTNLVKLSDGVKDGLLVRVRGAASGYDSANNSILASRIKPVRQFEDNGVNEGEVKGAITDISADKSTFKLNGLSVSVSSTTVFLRGAQSDLKNGVIVEAEGKLVNGVLEARKVKFEDNEVELELHGVISGLTETQGIFEFTVRGQKVRTTATTTFRLRTVTKLADGLNVEVKGRELQNGVLIADRVSQEN